MKLGKLTVVVGLPGSGKSTLLRELRGSVTGLCIEDFHANAINDSPDVERSIHYRPLIEAIKTGHSCVIADIAFCDPQRAAKLRRVLTEQVPGLQIEWIYFENVLQKCRQN